ncbi:MAG: hypothetical protein HXS49_12625 [Theionarchaea archaeon]|nr:hypothetical protein [Theionarchaea archaeon]
MKRTHVVAGDARTLMTMTTRVPVRNSIHTKNKLTTVSIHVPLLLDNRSEPFLISLLNVT